MHPRAADLIVESVRRRVEQGDCPTEPTHGYEILEETILELASRIRRSSPSPAAAPSSAGDESGAWTEQDHAHLTHLADCDEPTWVSEVATRAKQYIRRLSIENQSLRDSARQHDMREELAYALGVSASEAPASLLSRVHELAESIRADAAVFEELDRLRARDAGQGATPAPSTPAPETEQ